MKEPIEILDDRQAITRRDMRTIDAVCTLTFALLGFLASWFILSLEIGPVRIMMFWLFAMLYIILVEKFFKLLRRTYVVALPTHDYIENGEERKHEVAVHGQTVSA
jgi:hypothetical protein